MGLVLPPGVILSPNERGATMHSPRQQRKMHVPWLDGPALWLSLPPAPSCHRPSSLVTGRRLPSLGQMGTLLRVFLLKVHTQSAVGTEDFVVPPGLHRSAGSTPDVKAALLLEIGSIALCLLGICTVLSSQKRGPRCSERRSQQCGGFDAVSAVLGAGGTLLPSTRFPSRMSSQMTVVVCKPFRRVLPIPCPSAQNEADLSELQKPTE